MAMFFGPGESFFGIGAPEAAVVLAVGYFVLGPTELYKLTKSIGTLVGQFRDFGLGTATNLQNIMEKELRTVEDKAAGRSTLDREWGNLEDAPAGDDDEYEDIYEDSGEAVSQAVTASTNSPVSAPKPAKDFFGGADGGGDEYEDLDVEEFLAETSASNNNKFAAQMSGDWNKQVLEQEAAVAPGGGVAGLANDVPQSLQAGGEPRELTIDEQFERLEKLAALEEERAALMQRLDDAFEAKMRAVRGELLELVDSDFRARRAKLSSGGGSGGGGIGGGSGGGSGGGAQDPAAAAEREEASSGSGR
ncbi:hypothetical protein JKP88DRAFT_287535 [Tribonema minus]|uniref:Uncharacterized protein n=1 Tax=Tribonema minus TaxID=303371 RepID=A0A835Z5Z6_9STRA|nr:hypothetical protein JKP88DRAFT_287535 [Tribonema minus]